MAILDHVSLNISLPNLRTGELAPGDPDDLRMFSVYREAKTVLGQSVMIFNIRIGVYLRFGAVAISAYRCS